MKNIGIIQKEKIIKWIAFVENKTQIMKHVLKMQYIFLLPKYIYIINF